MIAFVASETEKVFAPTEAVVLAIFQVLTDQQRAAVAQIVMSQPMQVPAVKVSRIVQPPSNGLILAS